jgi:hypothetical protein
MSVASAANLKMERTRWMALPSRTGPQRFAIFLRNAAKSDGSRSLTSRPLPACDSTSRQTSLYSDSIRGDSSPASTAAFFARVKALHTSLTVTPAWSGRGARPACRASFCLR